MQEYPNGYNKHELLRSSVGDWEKSHHKTETMEIQHH